MNQLSLLTVKMDAERKKVLKENKDHVAKGGKDSEDEFDEDAGGMDDDGNDDFEDSDEEWKKQQKIFATVGPKLHTGQALTKEEMDACKIGDDDDDDDDSDYEYIGGDMSLYESKLDEFDEI